MYSIKLVHGHNYAFPSMERFAEVHAVLNWEDDDGKVSYIAMSRSHVWTPRTAKRADDWARRQGLELKAEYGAYLRKHGERKEVVDKRAADAKRAESKRRSEIHQRMWERREDILRALEGSELGAYLATGEKTVA